MGWNLLHLCKRANFKETKKADIYYLGLKHNQLKPFTKQPVGAVAMYWFSTPTVGVSS